jgi:hypothetical protein
VSWEQRLRDLVLAGGAATLAAVGCVDGSGTAGDSGTAVDSGTVPEDANFCCNASFDPCCASLFCDAAVSAECTTKMACESDGGTWGDGLSVCTYEAGPRDAASDAPETGPADADVDGHGQSD